MRFTANVGSDKYSDYWQGEAGGMADSSDGTARRRDLYRYLTFDHAPVYIRIMRILGGEVLSREMSSAEMVAALADEIEGIDEEFVEARMTQLVEWGNVIPGVRNQRVTTVAELLRAKGRYQVSKLGARVAREADDIIRAADGAREVARELLGVIADQLDRLLTLLESDGSAEPGEVAAAATSVFTNHQAFHGSLRDFYGYLNPVLSRYDLVGEEYHVLKTVLIGYIDLIGAEDRRHSPRIFGTLSALEIQFDQIVVLLAEWQTLTDENTERSPGRTRDEWEDLLRWYNIDSDGSGRASLRLATDQALRQLLVNAKRIISNSGSGVSRRGDLIRLAGRFATVQADEAHRLFADHFGMYPWRHLLLGDSEAAQPIASMSWWNAPPVEVPISLRERGDRIARGRTSPIPDTAMFDAISLREAREEEARRHLGATELVAAGTLDGVKLSAAAEELFLNEVSRMSVSSEPDAVSENLEAGFSLRRKPIAGSSTVILSGGSLTIDACCYYVASLSVVRADAEEATA